MDYLKLIEAPVWNPVPWEGDDDDDDPLNLNRRGGNKNMEYLESGSNPDAAEAMSLAAEYREGGDDPSTALIKAWQDVKGEDNPEGNPEDTLEFLQSPWALAAIGGIAATLIYHYKTGVWWWTRLDLTGSKKRAIETQRMRTMALARARAQQEPKMATVLTRQPQLIVQQARNSEQETVALIVP